MPTTLTAEQVAALDILKTELQTKHLASLAKIEKAIALKDEIDVMKANLASREAELLTLDAEVATESANFANFFLEKAGL